MNYDHHLMIINHDHHPQKMIRISLPRATRSFQQPYAAPCPQVVVIIVIVIIIIIVNIIIMVIVAIIMNDHQVHRGRAFSSCSLQRAHPNHLP